MEVDGVITVRFRNMIDDALRVSHLLQFMCIVTVIFECLS